FLGRAATEKSGSVKNLRFSVDCSCNLTLSFGESGPITLSVSIGHTDADSFRQNNIKINSVIVFFMCYPGARGINILITVKKCAYNLLYDNNWYCFFLLINNL
ncbi:MAG: hypothetical protein JWR09_3112, partial [Mucilaginibacter sp.]|nr:hypothetical protein [Mucilaginibacter sp.]